MCCAMWCAAQQKMRGKRVSMDMSEHVFLFLFLVLEARRCRGEEKRKQQKTHTSNDEGHSVALNTRKSKLRREQEGCRRRGAQLPYCVFAR